MGRLDGKVAVITGASSGMGLVAANRFVAEGAFVFITGRHRVELRRAASSIGVSVGHVEGDIATLDDLDRLFDVFRERAGKLDILYANAGAASMASVADASEAHFDGIMALNVRGTFFTVQKGLPLFHKGGSIIVKGSIAGTIGRAIRSVYNASKAALRSLVRTWANELEDRQIRVNLLSPGPVDTGSLPGMSEEAKAKLGALLPRGTIAQPEEIASAALFLASAESSFITGT